MFLLTVLLFENMSKRPGNGVKILDKTSVIACQAKERPEAKHIFWYGKLFYCLNFFWICFGSSSSDDEKKKKILRFL